MKPKSRDEYTVGWVCALPQEQTAAKAMLDEPHPPVQKPSTDLNSYNLGSICGHNVVIACLPKGRTGTSSAATAAAYMISTFPRIKFGLMVGIGGGIPSKVRLGDVVISSPTERFSGVVHWDMGKAEGGKIKRTGALNSPPTLLLTALADLESDHEMNEPKMFEYFEALRQKWSKLQSNSLKDILFKADYDHVVEEKREDEDEDEDESDEKDYCKKCDKYQIVKRKPRKARVHYGLIASDSSVVRDGLYRNKLNRHFGNEVLCIEMEAAGLMNNFPCLVIRGISDYADSHKNDSWQPHAAAMAAAYAKEFLQHVLPAEVEREPSVMDVFKEVYNVVSKSKADITQITSILQMSGELRMLDWLTARDYSLEQNKNLNIRHKETGQWFLDSAEYNTWIENKGQVLFCPGIPGAGKTILASIIVENLISRFVNNPKVGIAYVYFNFWQQEEHIIEDLFASILKQLAGGLHPLPIIVRSLYGYHKRNGSRPPFDKVSRIIKSIITHSYERVFIVVDALDECQEYNCRMRFIEGLFDFRNNGASILTTSRPIPEVADKFDNITQLQIRACDNDIQKYVAGQISHRGSKTLRDMQAEASIGISNAADGMFLLAKLVFDSLLDVKLPRDVKEKLLTLPKGSKAYSHVYEAIMKRIEHQGPETVKFAKTVLSWIACAKRPLTIPELQHALAVKIGHCNFDDENIPQVHDIVSVCAGLVTVDEGSDIIRLFHYTAQEYFKQTQNDWFPKVNDNITKICITYLSFDTFQTGFCSSDAAFEERLRLYQLYDYAAHQWGHHARKTPALDSLVLAFLMNRAMVEASSQALFAIKESEKSHYSQNVPKLMTGLHLAAYFGIEMAVKLLLGSYGSDPKDSYNRTPLSWAAENGHEAVVRILLANNSSPKATDHLGLTPLSRATKSGHGKIVRLLDISDQELFSQLVPGISTSDNSQPEERNSAGRENYKPMEFLSQCSISADMDKRKSQLPYQRNSVLFRWAVEDGNAESVELLLRRGTDITTTNEDGWLPLHTATKMGHIDIVRLLIDTGKLEVESKDNNGQLALQLAAEKRHWDVVSLLHERAASIGHCQQTFTGQKYPVYSVAFSHDSQLIASGSVDNTVKLWNTATGQCQQTFKGHNNLVYSVAFSYNSKLIASASADYTVKLWNTATGRCQRTFKGHKKSVHAVAFSHDSKLIASGSTDKTIKLWDIATGHCQQTFKGHNNSVHSVAFSHDSMLIASASFDTTIKLWDITTGHCQLTFKGHDNIVFSVAFSHDLKYIASASDHTIRLWNLAIGRCQQTFKGHDKSVYAVAFSRDSTLIASASSDCTVKIWNVNSLIS